MYDVEKRGESRVIRSRVVAPLSPFSIGNEILRFLLVLIVEHLS